nr:rhodanese-like domain-containing protein [Oceanococcus sp. HetDA_MAG_MS8]
MNQVFQRTRPRWLALVMAGLMVVTQACSGQAAPEASVQFVTVDAAVAAAQDGITVIDVRTDREWAASHLQAAQHLPLSTLDEALPMSDLDRGQPVLLHCKSGGRATRASQQFAQAGFTDIRVLKPGGYAELAAAGLPTEPDDE